VKFEGSRGHGSKTQNPQSLGERTFFGYARTLQGETSWPWQSCSF